MIVLDVLSNDIDPDNDSLTIAHQPKEDVRRTARMLKMIGGLPGAGDFPYLQPEDIRACLEYAAQGADHPVLVLAEP